MQKSLPHAKTIAAGSENGSRPALSRITRVGKMARDTMREPAADTLVNRQIDRGSGSTLEIGRLIGEGGMGIIYWGRLVDKNSKGEVMLNRPVAIKVIRFDKAEANRQEKIESFFTEVKTAAKLGHDNVVDIYAFGETEDGEPYFVMEYLEGKSLEKRLEEGGRLSWDELRPLMLQMCDGLKAAHTYVDEETREMMPIVHRDIKPANIFITKDSKGRDKVKIVDFGLATTTAQQENSDGKGTVMGTPEYMSPEQAQGAAIDHRSDIYALGALMYDCLAGMPPFTVKGKDYRDLLIRVIQEKPVPLREKGIDITPELDAIIMKCLEKKAENRFQSVLELREAIMVYDGDDVIDLDAFIPDEKPTPKPSPVPSGKPPSFISVPFDRRASENDVTRVYESSKDALVRPPKRRLAKWIAAAGILLVTTAAGAGVGINAYHRITRETVPAAAARPLKEDKQPQLPEAVLPRVAEPLPEPIMQDAAPVPQTVEHEITFRTNVSNASVILDGEELCRTGTDGSCTVSIAHGTEPLRITLERRGFQDETIILVPNEIQTRAVNMTRIPPREKQPRPPTKSHSPRIISPD